MENRDQATAEDVREIEVLLFARAVELAGSRSVTVTVSTNATVAELAEAVAAQWPRLRELVTISRWAAADRFLDPDTAVADMTSVAMIPPVSGG